MVKIFTFAYGQPDYKKAVLLLTMNFQEQKNFIFDKDMSLFTTFKRKAFYICKEYICQPCTANNVENSKGSENQKQKCSFAGI